MNKKAVIVGLLLLCAAGVALAARGQQTGVLEPAAPDAPPPEPFFGELDFFSQVEAWTQQNYFETEANTMQPSQLPNPQSNVAAALAALKWSEGTAVAGDPYRVCYAYKHTIASFSDHPAVTGEWRGEPLSPAMCAGAGLGPGCVSTAAGAYQIIKPTWLSLKSKLGLPDFSPASQDAAAVELLRQRGALALIEQGRFAEGMAAARKEWASLPGAGYGQGERTIAALTAKFTEAGGVLA